MFFNLTNRFLKSTSHVSSRSLGTFPWRDKLFVNYLKVPKFVRIQGPTGEEVTKDIDLDGKKCLITGGTTGIGAEITRCLIARNCEVLMACRNPYAAIVAAKNSWGDPQKFATYKTNFASLTSVKECCDQIVEEQSDIDIVILNAAVFGLPWTLTEDGIETTFQVNYLSQYFMLMNLEKVLAPNARIVFMSSESHRNIKWSFRDTISPAEELLSLPKEEYTSIKAYNVSKLCTILAMHYLAKKWLKTSKSVFCAHPGSFVKTNICSNWWVYEVLYTLMKPFSKSIEQAASTPLYCATSPDLDGYTDFYVKECRVAEESDLAKSIHLAFRVNDLTRYMIQQRIALPDDIIKKVKDAEFEKQETIKTEAAKEDAPQEELLSTT